LRWLGVRAVFHLPCSYDCQASVLLAESHLRLASELGFREEADWLDEMLKWPVEWSALHGIAEIRTPVVKIVTRTDATSRKYVVRYHGVRSAVPKESLPGLVFPFSSLSLPIITASRGFALGLENPIEPLSPSNVHETQRWFFEDNGFRTRYAMDRCHAPIVARVTKLLDESPFRQEGMRVIDFGCGNGVLLRKITQLAPTLQAVGVEIDQQKVLHGQLIHNGSSSEFVHSDIFSWCTSSAIDNVYLAIIMIGRLLEVPPETARPFCQFIRGAQNVLVYAYEDYMAHAGTLGSMARRAGLTLIDESATCVSLATIEAEYASIGSEVIP
jgi:2-polyprenyl-3-methyl-5-hydroxy-6-metoxy-1,4-benzoquinol methylase